jgi:hypothetical protein
LFYYCSLTEETPAKKIAGQRASSLLPGGEKDRMRGY